MMTHPLLIHKLPMQTLVARQLPTIACTHTRSPPPTHTQICQKADMFYNLGDASEPIFLWDYYYELGDPKKIKNADFPGFQVQYPWGDSWR